jgi:predicted metal-dependent peptidase
MADPPQPAHYDTTRLAAARLRAADIQPYLALALYALTPVNDPSRGTFAVDEQWRLYVDPGMLARWSVEQSAGVLLHEVGHVIRDHAGRARAVGVDGERDAHLWNLAADAEINDDLRADHVTLPGRHIVPETLGEPSGRVAEYYYDRLQRGLATDVDSPDCGSGCHGNHDERDVILAGDGPEVLVAVEALLLRRRTAEAIAAAARARPGSVPGGWERWAEAQLHPQLDWRRLLSGAVRGSVASIAGLSDYSYRRPARRRIEGVVLPSLQRPLPRVAVVIDTSGSVDDDLLDVALGEVHGCLRSLGVRRELLTLYATDTHAHKIDKPGSRRVRLEGGGGTDMRVGIATALAAKPSPDLVVVLTDGFTPWPSRRPAAKVVIGLLGTPEADLHRKPPAWAKVVHIDAP